MNKAFLVMTVLTLTGISAAAYCGESPKRPELKQAAGLTEADAARRWAAVQKIKGEHEKLVAELIFVVESSDKKLAVNSSAEFAVLLLGDLRAVDAVPVLIKNIEFRGPGKTGEPTPAAGYPCVHALAKIGGPAVTSIIERLGKPATENELKLFATVVRMVDGKELALARIDLALKDNEKYPPRKENLEKLLALLNDKTWPF